MPIEADDNNTVRRAKNNYARLRQQRPEVIKKFEAAQQKYQQKKTREAKRLEQYLSLLIGYKTLYYGFLICYSIRKYNQ